jgi:opacity protein-like surface antigen
MCRKLLILLGILFFLSSARANADDLAYAYCPLGEGYVFLYDSLNGFQVITNLKCGQKLTVVDARDKDRTRIRTADGKEGYVLKSSITVPQVGNRQEPTTPPNTSTQQPQTQVQPPRAEAQPQPKPQPQAQPKPAAQPRPQPQAELQAETQPQVQPQAAPKPEAPAAPQPTREAQAPAQPEPQAQPEPRPEPNPAPEPQLEAQTHEQPQAQPQPSVQPERAQPESEPILQAQAQAPRQQQAQQPEPAATAFTPFSTFGYEQYVPRLEAFAGVSYLNAGTSGLSSRQNVMGFEGSVAVHLNTWIAGEADFGGYYKSLQIVSVGTFGFNDYKAMGGPRFNIRKAFAHALVGIDHLKGSANFYTTNTSSSDNSLAGAVGGGVQWNVSRQFALRTSGDYVLSRFGGVMQNNFRLTLGIVFLAGSVNTSGR